MLGKIADDLRDDGGGLGGADVQPGDEAIEIHARFMGDSPAGHGRFMAGER
jgi:hypothetical protein